MSGTPPKVALTEEELCSEPGAWQIICNRYGWKKQHIPKPISQERRRARSCVYASRQRKRTPLKLKSMALKVEQLQRLVEQLTHENATLRSNLEYAVAEMSAARNELSDRRA
jgi:hypothetical protein